MLDMLGMSTYPQDYIDACRTRVDHHLGAWRRNEDAVDEDFEHVFFTDMLISLDASFVHRLRGKEGKDGNPLNEVRVLVGSLLLHGGVLTQDRTITLKPDASVLGLSTGDPVRLRQRDFVRLSEAFFAELEGRFAAAE
jgi:hypothetical protein